jgi:hypothetical protein
MQSKGVSERERGRGRGCWGDWMLIRDARMYAGTGQMRRYIAKPRRNPMGQKQNSDRVETK